MRRSWADGKKLDKKDGGYQWLYYTKRWKMHRMVQLQNHQLCAACLEDKYVRAASIVHHLHDHGGDEHIFFNSPLQSLCKSCHDNIKYGSHAKRQQGCDVHGKPYKQHAIYINHNQYNGGGAKKT